MDLVVLVVREEVAVRVARLLNPGKLTVTGSLGQMSPLVLTDMSQARMGIQARIVLVQREWDKRVHALRE